MEKIHHVCIQTDQYEASLDFYSRVLAFDVIKESRDFHNRDYNTWLSQNDFMIELQTLKVGELGRKYESNQLGLVHLCFYVQDLDAEYERLKSIGFNGFKQKNGLDIYVVEGGKLLKIIAPEGTIIELRDTMTL